MLNIIIVLIASYIFFLMLTAVLATTINYFYKTEIEAGKILQLANAGLGVSLMITFLAMVVVLQLNDTAEAKTIYLFITFISGYFITILFALYSHINITQKNSDADRK